MLLDTPICDFGWKAPDFNLKSFNGQEYSLKSLLGKKGLLVAFICNHCPYVIAIADRLAKDTESLINQEINVVGIMSNDYQSYAQDSPENMKKFAQQYNFKFPYLVDEDQSIGKAYGAVCTPDFFGFNNLGELQYRGRIDDQRMNQAFDKRSPELLNAMVSIGKTGTGPKEQMPSMGCSIKWRDS